MKSIFRKSTAPGPRKPRSLRHAACSLACSLSFAVLLYAPFGPALGQAQEPPHDAQAAAPAKAASEEGIPVADPLVIAKCGNCHTKDERGNMERVSWARTTPEGWQDVLKQMILVNGLMVTPAEARTIVKYLATRHGLVPEEARPVMYDIERRIQEETNIPTESLRGACTKCHAFARILSWRRSQEDWKQFVEGHATRYKIPSNDEAVAFLGRAAPLHTPEWDAWSARTRTSNLAGRWLVTASIQGRGKYYGEMEVEAAGSADEFNTRVNLRSGQDGSVIVRSGRNAVFAGYAWRGRSKGGLSASSANVVSSAPDDLLSEAREVMWIAPDQSKAEGRWFWGQYQEFGFDVTMQRASPDATMLGVDRSSLKIGSQGNRIRLIGDNFPAQVTTADVSLGPGVAVRRIVSHNANEIVAEADVAASTPPGKYDVAFRRSVAPSALAIYDRVDYIKVTPESALAAFGGRGQPRGFQQFEAIGYQRGADGKRRTADDVELGPVDVAWSMEVFYAVEGSNTEMVGQVSPGGFFTPAAESPNNNFDVWVIAKAKDEKNVNGTPLEGKAYLVVTVPSYTFNGRQYVRDLDRWVDDGPARGSQ